MKLYRSSDEASIAGTVEELQNVRSKINSLEKGGWIELAFDTSGSSEGFGVLEGRMVIKVGDGPALAKYEEGLGIVLCGSTESLKVLASFFDFEPGAELGCHYHWDEACGSDYVAKGTLPIIIVVVP